MVDLIFIEKRKKKLKKFVNNNLSKYQIDELQVEDYNTTITFSVQNVSFEETFENTFKVVALSVNLLFTNTFILDSCYFASLAEESKINNFYFEIDLIKTLDEGIFLDFYTYNTSSVLIGKGYVFLKLGK